MKEYSIDEHLEALGAFMRNDKVNLICFDVEEKKLRLMWHAAVEKFSATAKELHDSKTIDGILKQINLSVEYGIMLGMEAGLPERGHQTGVNLVAASIITALIPQYRPIHF